jgi:hypothetical protein
MLGAYVTFCEPLTSSQRGAEPAEAVAIGAGVSDAAAFGVSAPAFVGDDALADGARADADLASFGAWVAGDADAAAGRMLGSVVKESTDSS